MDEVEPVAKWAFGDVARGEARVGKERAHEQTEAQALVVAIKRGPRQGGFASHDKRLHIVLISTVKERAQGQPAQPLIPSEEIARDVRASEVAGVSAAHDAELVGKLAPRLGRGFGKPCHQAGMGDERQEILAREGREGKAEQKLNGFGNPMGVGSGQIGHVVRQCAALAEDRRKLRQVEILACLGHDHGNVAQAQRGIPAHEIPDLRCDDLQFPA